MRQSERSLGASAASALGLLRTTNIAAISCHRWQLAGAYCGVNAALSSSAKKSRTRSRDELDSRTKRPRIPPFLTSSQAPRGLLESGPTNPVGKLSCPVPNQEALWLHLYQMTRHRTRFLSSTRSPFSIVSTSPCARAAGDKPSRSRSPFSANADGLIAPRPSG
jgi:hypothetical protein